MLKKIKNSVNDAEIIASLEQRFPLLGAQYPWLIPPETGIILGENINNHLKEYEKFEKFLSRNNLEKKTRILFYQPDHFGVYVFIENEFDVSKIILDNKNIIVKLIHESNNGILIKCVAIPFQPLGLIEFMISLRGNYANLFCSWDIQWNIETNTTSRVQGWLINKTLPTIPVVINIYRNEVVLRRVENGLSRQDVKDALQLKSDKCGFDEAIDSRQHGLQIQKIVIADTNILLSKDHVISISPTYANQFTKKIRRFFRNQQSASLIEQNFLEKVASSFTPKVFEGYLKGIGQNLLLQIPSSRVDNNLSVIIPVYDGYDETVACIESVLKAKTLKNLQVLIGFDAGPNKKILDYLYQVENKFDNVRLIVNEENLGFVRNVNNLVANKLHNDFLILNADTVIFDGFFDRIHEALNADRTYASITPLSNHATIYSIVPSSTTVEECAVIDRRLASDNSRVVPSPVGHGFCMLINGDIYRKIGLFDEKWGKGYGEEVDWSLRAQKNTGLRNGALLNALVYHKGSVSFGIEQMNERVGESSAILEAMYPEYAMDINTYELDGPLNGAKIALDQKAVHGLLEGTHLFVSHSFGGGVDTYLRSRIAKVKNYIIATMVGDDDRGFYWRFSGSAISPRYFKANEYDVLRDWSISMGLGSISVEHIGISSPAELTKLLDAVNLSYSVMLHDFSWICPRINLIDFSGHYCGVRTDNECEICVNKAPIPSSGVVTFSKVNMVSTLREESFELLQGATEVFAPSISTAKIYHSLYPELRVKVRPHHREVGFKVRTTRSKFSKTIAVLGGVSGPKGLYKYKELADILQINHPDFKLIFIGHVEDESIFHQNKNVKFTGRYLQDDLADLVDFYDPFACLHLNIWPETFSYVLSESLKLGLYPFYFNIGAVGDRLSSLGVGHGFSADERISVITKDLINYHKKIFRN
ncbi:glycosyltransferase [Polynucleobacter paneuropaeus]|nr:glycosyltransferase [Polynucleobacter paneuropaeus]